jgi:hypothetical protein
MERLLTMVKLQAVGIPRPWAAPTIERNGTQAFFIVQSMKREFIAF